MMTVMRDAAKLAQLRAVGTDRATIKRARCEGAIGTIKSLIEKYVSADDMRKLRKRGCLHAVDFPEKRDRSLRGRGAV